ncbi:hypothetical protein CERSUDRAFT_114319 [Gelatoporia subvermispora B]|uniref:Uncharacterized protein n=1 Tax=Ceriporiopsis subvermispora (strain B) TaxID=914234 RepID=M2RGT3_CERS8|nr:hypothetical protein CERSUDRAFT_114319 [Gelatoporia subvermispora B]
MCIDLAKDMTDIIRAAFFDRSNDHRHRQGVLDDAPEKRKSVPFIHIDQTPEPACLRVEMHLSSEDVQELLKRRFRAINL